MKQLIKKINIKTTITVLTGLHIGGSSDSVEIGGIDIPVIKISTKNNQPYIPGSSIKGKLRSLLEQIKGISEIGGGREIKFNEKSKACQDIINLFGFANDNKPSKIIVRDAYLTENSKIELQECDNLDMPYTEGKWENVIHRVKGTAEHPRQTERVPAGAEFEVEFVINVWDDDNDGKELLDMLKTGIRLIENDYLGGSGSRGYGQVKFGKLLRITELSNDNNWEGICYEKEIKDL